MTRFFSLSDVYKKHKFLTKFQSFPILREALSLRTEFFGADGRVLKVSDAVFDFPPDISHAKSSAVFDVFLSPIRRSERASP
ncbi:MAG: hypothetical protein L6V93_17770 [Clostridiales bacterium]|nr:MAG: hypothetical protein L6V93_17770 [Clostridiales bacterium]